MNLFGGRKSKSEVKFPLIENVVNDLGGEREVQGGVVVKQTARCWIFMRAKVSRYVSVAREASQKYEGSIIHTKKKTENHNSIMHESIDFFISSYF